MTKKNSTRFIYSQTDDFKIIDSAMGFAMYSLIDSLNTMSELFADNKTNWQAFIRNVEETIELIKYETEPMGITYSYTTVSDAKTICIVAGSSLHQRPIEEIIFLKMLHG